MLIYAVYEEKYAQTIWCMDIIKSMREKAHSMRYTLKFITPEQIPTVNTTHLIVISTSPSFVSNIIWTAYKYNISCIAVSCKIKSCPQGTSFVLIDHNVAVQNALEYFRAAGRTHTALYGVNRNSYADMVKTTYFASHDIYYDTDEHIFLEKYTQYDSVLCANNLKAVSLIKRLKELAIPVPDALQVIGFDHSALCNQTTPTITSIYLNHYELGIQAMLLYAYLHKQKTNISVTVSVPCPIIIGQSTNLLPVPISNIPQIPIVENKFLNDAELLEIHKLEAVLRSCTAEDILLLENFRTKENINSLADQLFCSVNTLKYRLKRLVKIADLEDTETLLKLYNKYLY